MAQLCSRFVFNSSSSSSALRAAAPLLRKQTRSFVTAAARATKTTTTPEASASLLRISRPHLLPFRPRSTITPNSNSRRYFHPTRANMTVHNIQTEEQFKDAIANHQVVLVDFFATWCGPCKAIAPKIAQWSQEFPNIYYVKVDVDELSRLAGELGIRAMPTFFLYKDGEKAAEVVGAIPNQLETLIKTNHPEEATPTA